MKKLSTFEEFAKTNAKVAAAAIQEEQDAKRSSEAETFKSLLSEYGVAAIKELTEEQRTEFFEKLRGADVNESVALIQEGTRSQFGKIDRKGNITSVYMHYDGYPENVLPLLKKGYKGGKNVDTVIKSGAASGLESDPKNMDFYNDGTESSTGSIANVKGYLQDVSDDAGAEYVYLWDEANKEWLMADIYGGMELVPAFESLSVSVNEAIQVSGKRDAKKVVTVYNNLFAKKLTDFGALDKQGQLGLIKYLFEYAMEDANFSREGFAISKNIKGKIKPFEIKLPGLGNHFVKIGPKTIKEILDKYYSDIANAAGWSGIGIVEGTALYLEQLKEEAAGQSLLTAFNLMFEGVTGTGSVVNEASLSGIEFGNDDDIHPTKFKPLVQSLKKNKVKMEVEKEEGDHGYPEVKLTGKREDIEKVLADIWGPDSIEDHEDAYESVVNEAEIKSDDEFKEYAYSVLKKAFGEEFDQAKADDVVNGILSKSDGDYGKAAGILQSSLA